MRTPKNAVWLWVAGNLGLIAIPLAYGFWLHRVLRDEQYETGPIHVESGDTPGLPIFGLAAATIILLPVLNLLLFALLRRYPGRVALLPAVRKSAPATELLFVLPLAGALYATIDSAVHGDWELAIVAGFWVFLVAAARAVVLGRVQGRPGFEVEEEGSVNGSW